MKTLDRLKRTWRYLNTPRVASWELVGSWHCSSGSSIQVPKWVLKAWSKAGLGTGRIYYIKGKTFIYKCYARQSSVQGEPYYSVERKLRKHIVAKILTEKIEEATN